MVKRKYGEAMSILKIGDYNATVTYDPEIEMFRGEFVGMNSGADFYADNVEDLKKEAKISLDTYLAVCKEKGIKSTKS